MSRPPALTHTNRAHLHPPTPTRTYLPTCHVLVATHTRPPNLMPHPEQPTSPTHPPGRLPRTHALRPAPAPKTRPYLGPRRCAGLHLPAPHLLVSTRAHLAPPLGPRATPWPGKSVMWVGWCGSVRASGKGARMWYGVTRPHWVRVGVGVVGWGPVVFCVCFVCLRLVRVCFVCACLCLLVFVGALCGYFASVKITL